MYLPTYWKWIYSFIEKNGISEMEISSYYQEFSIPAPFPSWRIWKMQYTGPVGKSPSYMPSVPLAKMESEGPPLK